jgi:hypothetical protein
VKLLAATRWAAGEKQPNVKSLAQRSQRGEIGIEAILLGGTRQPAGEKQPQGESLAQRSLRGIKGFGELDETVTTTRWAAGEK